MCKCILLLSNFHLESFSYFFMLLLVLILLSLLLPGGRTKRTFPFLPSDFRFSILFFFFLILFFDQHKNEGLTSIRHTSGINFVCKKVKMNAWHGIVKRKRCEKRMKKKTLVENYCRRLFVCHFALLSFDKWIKSSNYLQWCRSVQWDGFSTISR